MEAEGAAHVALSVEGYVEFGAQGEEGLGEAGGHVEAWEEDCGEDLHLRSVWRGRKIKY